MHEDPEILARLMVIRWMLGAQRLQVGQVGVAISAVSSPQARQGTAGEQRRRGIFQNGIELVKVDLDPLYAAAGNLVRPRLS